jgi:outer membrane protein OmpA-like peptidoglycan-associated protein/tetratricopeptide (TPR) repeat protein
MRKIFLVLIPVLFLSATSVFPQMGNYKYGLKLYNQLAYDQAIPYFEESLKADSANPDALRKLANCYREINDVANSRKYYSKVVMLNDVKPIEKYYYGQALMMSGEYNQAKPWLDAFRDDDRGKVQAEGITRLNSFFKDSAQYTVKNLSEINSSSSDMGPSFFGKSILFSSNRYKLDAIDNKHSWTGKDFYKLFKADEENISDVVKFNNDVQTKYNVGPVCYDYMNKTLYLTRNQIENGKAIKGNDDQIKLRIYSYKFDEQNNEWTDEVSFSVNNKDYNVAHPAISPDGNWLVFSSDMPGGSGGMDLWATQQTNGTWSLPVNLGQEVNTKGNEIFPYIATGNMFFYSSDGKEGLGGLDVYFTSFKNGKSGKIKTISYPVNSMGDDFGFVLNGAGNIAYFTSNRPGGKGDDDIYLINVKKPFRTTISVSGTAIDKQTNQPLSETKVVLMGESGEKLAEITTGKDGFYEFEIEPDKTYKIEGTKQAYSKDEKSFVGVIPEGKTEIREDLLMEMNNFSLYCLITDKKTNLPLEGVIVKIYDKKSGKEIYSFTTNSSGDFRQKLEDIKINDQLSYEIDLDKTGYLGKKVNFVKTIDRSGEIAIHKQLDVSLDPIQVGADLAKIIDIKPIYFDLSKWNIRPDAAIELDKIVKVMQENPNMVIELGSHTDCRSSAAFNMTLSDKRAKASAAYIVSKGINKARIYGKGYGEAKLVNDCACEGNKKSDCDEERHQQNRRTEFIIVKM